MKMQRLSLRWMGPTDSLSRVGRRHTRDIPHPRLTLLVHSQEKERSPQPSDFLHSRQERNKGQVPGASFSVQLSLRSRSKMKHELAMLSRSPHSDVSPYSSVLAVLSDRRKTSRQPSVAPSIRQKSLGAGPPLVRHLHNRGVSQLCQCIGSSFPVSKNVVRRHQRKQMHLSWRGAVCSFSPHPVPLQNGCQSRTVFCPASRGKDAHQPIWCAKMPGAVFASPRNVNQSCKSFFILSNSFFVMSPPA